MGKTTEGIKISLKCFFNEAFKECFQQFFKSNFILKFAKNTTFLPPPPPPQKKNDIFA